MPTFPTKAAQAIASLMASLTGMPVEPEDMQLIATGASGRSIMRASTHGASGLLGIYWTADRADNASFVPALRGLSRAGIPVPALLAEQELGAGCGACIVEDLGTTDLLSLKGQPWQVRKEAYTHALQTLAAFHRIQPDWELQPPFDASLYRWEQAYFAEHLLARHLGMDPAPFLARPALQQMAQWLAAHPRVPVHRDAQSQNIMLKEGKAWLIDFQGMRYGLAEYDLASLIADPYMGLSANEQEELLDIAQHISGKALDKGLYAACALQRLMQALGAYANIGYNQSRTFYLNLIPAGLRALRHAAALAPAGSPAALAAACLPDAE